MYPEEPVSILLVIIWTTTIFGTNIKKQEDDGKTEIAAATIIPWAGNANIPGAYILSRINLEFLNNTCHQFSAELTATLQVTRHLYESRIKGATENQIKRYGFMMVYLEQEIKNILEYISALSLCYGREEELGFRDKKKLLNSHFFRVWHALKKKGIVRPTQRLTTNTTISLFELLDPIQSESNLTTTDNLPTPRPSLHEIIENTTIGLVTTETPIAAQTNLLDLLEQSRPHTYHRQPKSPVLAGLGIGIVGSFLFGSLFGKNNGREIEEVNKKLNKLDRNIKITNERINILAKEIAKSHKKISDIVGKLAEAQAYQDMHYAILWNLDTLSTSLQDIKYSLRLGEIAITMLNEEIIKPDLIDLNTFKKTIEEGIQHFPNLKFPFPVTRINLSHITKVVTVQRVGHLKYLMLIPLVHKQSYEVLNLVPHPIKLTKNTLARPKAREIMLKGGNDTYILADKENIHSISNTRHILLTVEPIYNQGKESCEWHVFKKNLTGILKLCDFYTIGQTNDTVVVETDKNRLAYFPEETPVHMACPNETILETLIGLHQIPLACDIKTKEVYWPAKRVITIDITTLSETKWTPTEMPTFSINHSEVVHSSLRNLINSIPTEKEDFTIDFKHYGLSLDQVQSISVYSQTIITIVVVINSILIGFLILKVISKNGSEVPEEEFKGDKLRRKSKEETTNDNFSNIRDSLRQSKSRIRKSLRTRREKYKSSLKARGRKYRDSIRSRGSSIGSSIRSRSSSLGASLRDRIKGQHSPVLKLSTPTTSSIGINTEVSGDPAPPYVPGMYPALPRYT